ncbi:Gfo/Idh/MocA family protein [Halorussus salinisoli]|uniref:Gfo/Idh/MocA family protein n=1 Tax=Halorussus salinisoli TaxID=2558242 RepID=UPI0010C1E176|nr:Gfo/Idh/MocA family oxidoreductase [Halorussus salinisoli]
MTQSKSPVSIGICSTAHVHTNAYLSLLSEMDDVNLVGVADENEPRGRDTANGFDMPYCSADELLTLADGVVICSTNADHRSWIRQCADAGVDVLCEKPLAPTVEDAENIVRRVEKSDISLGVAMPLRFSEPVARAHRALDRDVIGTVHSISGTNRGKMPGGWFVDPDESGGGAVMDHSVHIVDLVQYLLDEEVSEVYCLSGTRFHDIPVEDVNVLSMELEDGTSFLLDGSWSRPDEWHFWGDATLELVGDEGVIDVDCFDQTLTYTTTGESDAKMNSHFWGSNPNTGLIEDFVTAVRHDHSPMVTPEEGLAAVAVVEAAYESHESGDPVQVEY